MAAVTGTPAPPTPALTRGEAKLIAGHVTAGRLAVAAVFDDLARRAASGPVRDFKIVALGLADAEACAAAFAAAAQAGFLPQMLADMDALGLMALKPASEALAKKRGAERQPEGYLLPQDARGMPLEFQNWTVVTTKTVEMARLTPGLADAMRRLCLIQVDGGARQGTGFLIGPQTVLTNWHLMHPLIDPATGNSRDRSHTKITCDFDTLQVGGSVRHVAVENWLVDFSPLPANLIAADGYPDMTALRPHTLDFCAIRLAGAPGRARGWYDLSDPGMLQGATSAMFVVQHPMGQPQKVGIAVGARSDPTDANFLIHDAWTADGSSGGLCLDNTLRIVGLHHAAVKVPAGQKAQNRAAFVKSIHAMVPGLGAPDVLNDVVSITATGERAVIGRAATQRRIREMMRSAAQPILYIRGPDKSGKTFSAELIRDCTEADRRVIVGLSAAELPATARDLAVLILIRAGVPGATAAALPAADTPHGTDAAWIVTALLPAFRTALRGRLRADPARPLLLWLVIDQLDKVAIPQTGAREFLDALYIDANDAEDMRVVLIGLESPLTGINPLQAAAEDLDSPDNVRAEDLETAIASLLTAHRVVLMPDDVKRHADLAQAAADMLQPLTPGQPRLARISDVLAKVYLKAARKWT